MSTWLVPLTELSREQRDAVELSTREPRVIAGAPGSGKTQILLHRARHLLDEHRVDPSRLRIFIYTNVLRKYIQSALDLLNLPTNCVSTIDGWCCDYYERHISRSLPKNEKENARDYARIREAVWNHVRLLGDGQRPYEFALVDEGQDLPPVSLDIVKAIARHVTICIDHKQQIYEHGSSEPVILERFGLKRSNFTLLAAFRCSPYIVELAARCIRDAEQRAAFVRQNRGQMTERETPLLYLADDFEDERARLIEVVKTRQAKGEKVAILLPMNKQVWGFAKGLTEAGLQVEIRKEGKAKFPDLDFTSDLPKLLTYHSAKGLTFDSVLLPRLVRYCFGFGKSTPDANLVFVGVTRATKWVFMSTQRGRELPIIEAMRPLAAEGKLTIQTRRDRFQGAAPTATAPQSVRSEVDEGIGDLL